MKKGNWNARAARSTSGAAHSTNEARVPPNGRAARAFRARSSACAMPRGARRRLQFRSPPPWRIKRACGRRNVLENRAIYPLLHGFHFPGIRRRCSPDALFSAHFLHFHCTFSTASATPALFLFPHILPYFTPGCQSRTPGRHLPAFAHKSGF